MQQTSVAGEKWNWELTQIILVGLKELHTKLLIWIKRQESRLLSDPDLRAAGHLDLCTFSGQHT